MSSANFETVITGKTPEDWGQALEAGLPRIHEVDRNATRIWFAFYPIALHNYLAKTEDLEKTLHGFAMQGEFRLDKKIDSSHSFLYGHRFWSDVKHSIEARAESFSDEDLDLLEEASKIAKSVAAGAKTDESLVLGITLVGLMTLAQTGFEKFAAAPGSVGTPTGLLAKSPQTIIENRSKEESQGIFGFLKTIDKNFKVRWDETDPKAKFGIIYDEEIASASARDQSRDWGARDSRCIEGVIPVECRSAACGTCWVGVIAGADKLSDVDRLERKQMKIFGYGQGDEKKPILRLACQARAEGSVSLVLPTWNGVYGKKLFGVEEVRLEPATTSAVKLRETIQEALESEQ